MVFYTPDPGLEQAGRQILSATWEQFPYLQPPDLALTWLLYEPPAIVNTGGALRPEEFWRHQPRGFSHHGGELFYPASIVKLFYLVAITEWQEQGMVAPSTELDRAVRDMIVDSSNDATSLVVDILTGTTSGPELPPEPFATWQHQRNLVNRYLRSWDWPELAGINVNQKTWGDGPYGRERQSVGENNRNRLTTDATARLFHAIMGGIAASNSSCQAMTGLLKRSLAPADLAADPENQVRGFLGGGLPETAGLWSKAGLTSQVRHDAAYVELAEEFPPYLLVVFSRGCAWDELLLPFISQQVATWVQERKS